ncbi:MAG: hypothetical protein ACQEQS_01725 [Thermodesulfobacteriota bacterium]
MAKKKTNSKKTKQAPKKPEAQKQDSQASGESIALRKFERWSPAKPFTPKKSAFKKDYTAPKFIKGNNKKLKEILLKDFSDAVVEQKEVKTKQTKQQAPAKNDNAVKAKEAEIKKAQEEIEKKAEEADKKVEEASKKEAEANKAMADADKLKKEAEQTKAEVLKTKEDAESKLKEAEEKAQKAETAEKEAEKIKAEADKAKAEADKKSEELKKAEEEINAKKAEAEKAETDASEKVKEAENKIKEIEKREKEAQEKKAAAESKAKDLDNKEADLKSKEEKIKAKQAELAQKEEELNKTVFTKVSESAQKISSLKPDFSKIKTPPPSNGDGGSPNNNNGGGNKMNKGLIGMAAGFIFLVILLVGASISNTGKFYLENSKKGLVVSQGKFAPKGTYKLMTLPEIYAPENIKETSYKKDEVYSLIFSFYMDKVKDLAETKGTPDFDKINKYLDKAVDFAPGYKEKSMVKNQIKALNNASKNYKAELLNILEKQNTKAKPEKEVKKPAESAKKKSDKPTAEAEKKH